MTLSGTRVAMVGAAATGLSTARVLARHGAKVVVLDRARPETVSAERSAHWGAVCAKGDVEVRWASEDLPAGIDLVVPSPGVRRDSPPIAAALARDVPVVSEIEIGGAISKAPILAVTGTNGKTTTVAWLAEMVAQSGRPVRACGNLARDGGERVPLIEAADSAGDDEILVAEVSSFQLEWTRAFAPRGSAWLNLSNDHMDAYSSMEAYAADKARLLRNQGEQDVAVLNRADPWVVAFEKGLGAARRLWFDGDDPVFPDALREAASRLSLPGVHNRANALAATLLALDAGVPEEAVARALQHFGGVAHRMERVAELGGVVWINNSMCTNAAAVEASLSSVAGRGIVIAGGRLKEPDPAPLCRALGRGAGHIVLIGESAPRLAQGLGAVSTVPFEIAESMDDAVRRAARAARPGDTVVLAPGCSSFDMYSGFEARGQAFRVAVERLDQP